jgi:hypothetical protein
MSFSLSSIRKSPVDTTYIDEVSRFMTSFNEEYQDVLKRLGRGGVISPEELQGALNGIVETRRLVNDVWHKALRESPEKVDLDRFTIAFQDINRLVLLLEWHKADMA